MIVNGYCLHSMALLNECTPIFGIIKAWDAHSEAPCGSRMPTTIMWLKFFEGFAVHVELGMCNDAMAWLQVWVQCAPFDEGRHQVRHQIILCVWIKQKLNHNRDPARGAVAQRQCHECLPICIWHQRWKLLKIWWDNCNLGKERCIIIVRKILSFM